MGRAVSEKFPKKNRTIHHHASLDEVVRLALTSPDDGFGSARNTGTSFSGTATLEEAASLARYGWHDIRADIDATLSQITPRLAEVTRRRITRSRSVAGGAVNVARLLSGDPRCMTRTRLTAQPTTGPLIRILVNGSASCAVSAERIKRRGAAVVSLVEAITLCGANSTVTIAFPGSSGAKDQYLHASFVDIKREESALDIDALMFAAAHPSMLRRIMFAAWETEPEDIRRRHGYGNGKNGYSGYGRSVRLEDCPQELVNGYQVIIDAPDNYSSRTMETDPISWIAETLTGVGIIAKDGI